MASRRVLACALAVCLLVAATVLGAFAVAATQTSAACTADTSTPVGTPAASTATMGQVVQYFESQQLTPDAAAGITGNLQQESTLNPADPGGGLAQWGGGWYSAMSAYATSQGLSPTSMQGQLAYIVYDLRTNAGSFYANQPNLLQALNSAPDPGTAAEMFETGYESCSGVIGWMSVVPGSLCNDTARKQYAVQALASASGSTSIPVSLGATCGMLGPAGAQQILAMAQAVEGAPYSVRNHASAFIDTTAQMLATGTDCSGFVSWLMGTAGLGIWTQPYATPGIPTAPDMLPGQGAYVTLWNNPLPGQSGHVYIFIDGSYFEEGGSTNNEHQMTQAQVSYYQASGQFVPWHPAGD